MRIKRRGAGRAEHKGGEGRVERAGEREWVHARPTKPKLPVGNVGTSVPSTES
jgi:hypothetical protein